MTSTSTTKRSWNGTSARGARGRPWSPDRSVCPSCSISRCARAHSPVFPLPLSLIRLGQFLRRDRIIELSERELERWSLSLDAPDIDALPPALTDEELAEKEALLAEGYSHWNKRDFNQYLRAMGMMVRTRSLGTWPERMVHAERHGRNAIDQIAKSVPSKTEDEVCMTRGRFIMRR